MQRYMTSHDRLIARQLRRYQRELDARLLQSDIGSRDLTRLIDDLRQLQMIDHAEMIAEAKALAVSEAAFTADMLTTGTSATFVVPSEIVLANALGAAVPVQGGSAIPSMLSAFETKKAAEILQVVMDGATEGKTSPAIARQVKGFVQSLLTRQAQALVSTILSHASSAGRLATYEQNSNLVSQYQWVSTLDGLTSLICMGRDGNQYDVGVGPMPPAHFNCRSTTIPLVDPKYRLEIKGQRPSIGADGTQVVSSNTKYSGWLRQQPKSFVDEALGKARSKLFRDGAVTLDIFTDPTGKTYTLAQLDSMSNLALSIN